MTSGLIDEDRQLEARFLIALSIYFIVQIFLRVIVSDSLDYDEAEQALLGQWLLAGYTDQPPLYTWLQYFFFHFLGRNVLAVIFLKNIILYFTYFFVFKSGKEILRNSRTAVFAALSLLLIPQIGWESQREMTHTALVVLAASATLWQTLRLVRTKRLVDYCILGLILGIGVLAKANYLLFLIILFLALCSLEEGRRTIFSLKMLLPVLIMLAIGGNYFLWMFDNQDIVFSRTHKFKRAEDFHHLTGIYNLFLNTFLFLSPLWLVYLIIFPEGYRRKKTVTANFHASLLNRYFIAFFLVLLSLVLLFNVTTVKDRWLQPLLFVTPLFFISRLDQASITPKQSERFFKTILFAMLVITIGLTFRVVGASYINKFCRVNFPFDALTREIKSQTGFTGGLIICEDRFLAGNLHFQFPESAALVPGYRFELLPEAARFQTAIAVWDADKYLYIPEKLADFLEEVYHIDESDYQVKYFAIRYKYGRTETIKFAVMRFPLDLAPSN